MKRITAFLIPFFIILFCSNIFGSEVELIEPIGTNGSINWTSGIITAKGNGAPSPEALNPAQGRILAKRAAISDARRNLLETLEGVRVTSTSVVKEYMVENDVIKTRVHGIVKGSELTDTKYMSDGSVEVTVSMSIKGDLLSLFLKPTEKKAVTPVKVIKGDIPKPEVMPEKPFAPAPDVKEPPVTKSPKTEEPKAEEPPPLKLPDYTGLVVDARALKLKPALIPRILESSGKELYQSDVVSPEGAAENGVALYSRDLTAAQTNSRVTNNPITLKAEKVSDKSPSDIVMSDKDAEILKAIIKQKGFLRQCRVMIVID
ncbi:MAG: LPP20 family lipoprotein [Desulfobacterales bacterium]|nr:LPP20 family lipoprotein [Desulfobacterales bacterium]